MGGNIDDRPMTRMPDAPPILTYATPRRDRRRSMVDWSGRILGAAQLVVAILLLVGLPDAFGAGPWTLTVTEGSWSASVAWHWLSFGAGPLNLVAATMAVRGAIEPLGQQGRFYRRYLWITLGGFAVVVLCTVVISRWPVFVTANPSGWAVNDFRLTMSDDDLRFAWCLLLAGNPMMVLLAVRPALRRIGRAWGFDEA
jgi:hypothetical protein